MHEDNDFLAQWQRDHHYLGVAHGRNEGRTRLVLLLTAAMMVAEIAAGTAFKSMALLADGWHMASHAAALGMASLAYMFARRHVRNEVFSFGTGKVGDLAGFASALILSLIALLMGWESVTRLLNPVPIAYGEATIVAAVGLVVNIVSALMLGGDHSHDHVAVSHDHHDHHHDHAHHDHHHHHRDHNFRAVYVHILADAVTSMMAIIALLAGRFLGFAWMDPLMGLVGGVIILQWAWTLIGASGRVLLDAEPSPGIATVVRRAVEADGDNRVADLHVWRLGPGHLAAMLTVVTHHPRPPAHYKALLHGIHGLSHVTIEVEGCDPSRAV